MLCFKHIDLPKIPTDLLDDVQTVLVMPNYYANTISTMYGRKFFLKSINERLMQWLTKNIPFELQDVKYQIVKDGIGRHVDHRAFTILYVIEQGGPSVKTSFFLDDYETLEDSVIMMKDTWTYINTSKVHWVSDFDTDPNKNIRLTLSISPVDSDSFFQKYIPELSKENIPLPRNYNKK